MKVDVGAADHIMMARAYLLHSVTAVSDRGMQHSQNLIRLIAKTGSLLEATNGLISGGWVSSTATTVRMPLGTPSSCIEHSWKEQGQAEL